MRKLSGITPERDDFVRSTSRSGSLQEHYISRTPALSRSIRAGRLGRCSVTTYAPANEDEQIPVLGPQAPGEEITVSLLATTAPLGYALGYPPAEAPAQASNIIFLLATTAPFGYALGYPPAHAPAQASIIILLFLSVSPVADPLAEATL